MLAMATIKLILFDLDGVLVDAKKIHYDALNIALREHSESYVISWDEHLNKYDGLKTKQKLQLLTSEKKLPISLHETVWNRKQELTILAMQSLYSSAELIGTLQELSRDGYRLGCCSNSIRKTVFTVLTRLGIMEYFDIALSNEDVNNSKPHPELYWKAMSMMGVFPDETLIVEDSPPGLLAATMSYANILRVKNPAEVNYVNIKRFLEKNNSRILSKWENNRMNVLIPMAGAGSRFEKAGYTFPKPLIEVGNKPMIQVVIENLSIKANYIFVVQKSHREKYNLDVLLNLLTPGCKIVEVDGITEGAACTALLAKEYINNDDPLFFANSDQYVEWESSEFMYKMQETDADGGIVTFRSTHPKWSFAKVDESGFVIEVAEKNPISDLATVGYYYWKHGSDFVKYAEEMISANVRVNSEFYVCPVFNHAIADGKKIRTYDAQKMWGLGTPEDLQVFLQNEKDKK